MKQMTRLILVCSATLAMFLSTGSAAFAQQDEIRRILTEDYKQADQAGDVDAKMRLYGADAVLLPAEGEPVVGFQAVRTWHVAEYARAASQLSTTVDEVQMFGNWAFARGSWSGTMTPKAGGDAKQETGKFLVLFRRLPDGGSWRIAREIWNGQEQPATGDLK